MTTTNVQWTCTISCHNPNGEFDGAAWVCIIKSSAGHEVPITAWRTPAHAAKWIKAVVPSVQRVRWHEDLPHRKSVTYKV